MKGAELLALDTNVLVFADDSSSPHHLKAKSYLEDALKGVKRVCLSHQVLAEYFAVITGRERAKNPLSVDQAKQRVLFLNRIRRIKKVFPKRSTLKRCVEFCAEHNIQGIRIFDALYATTLLDNKVRKLVTQNTRDFSAFKELELINPFG